MARREQLQAEARAFHRQHPEVWRYFNRFALQKIASGFRHYSADAVMHRVRWETEAGATDEGFKINNNHVAFYSRAFNDMHGRKFFRTRRQRV